MTTFPKNEPANFSLYTTLLYYTTVVYTTVVYNKYIYVNLAG